MQLRFFGRLRQEPTTTDARRNALNLIWLILLSAAVCLASASIQLRYLGMWSISPWILLEVGFEIILTCALYSVCRSKAVVLGSQFFLGNLFRVFNLVKIHFLDSPILPSDIFLLSDVKTLLGARLFWSLSLGITVMFNVLGILLWFTRRRPVGRWIVCAAPALCLLGWALILPRSYFQFFDQLLEGRPSGLPFLLKQKETEIGVPLTFTIEGSRFLDLLRTAPSRELVSETLGKIKVQSPSERAPGSSETRRNVYIVLAESFWDPNMLWSGKGISRFLDPDFERLWIENGHHLMDVPVYGGNTANTEFEILCGIPARAVMRGVIFQSALSNPVPCLPEILRRTGYHTFAFHPYSAGFFNRSRAFPLIGFEQFFSLDQFKAFAQVEGQLVPDQDFLRESVRMARASAEGKPFLAYMMTFAGHWPFPWLNDTYPRPIKIANPGADPSVEVVERHLNLNWIASTAMAHAASTILKEDPDALIVMAGDHLPGLAKDMRRADGTMPGFSELFFKTPVLLINGTSGKKLESDLLAYQLPLNILQNLGVRPDQWAHLTYFRTPSGRRIRPTHDGALIVYSDKGDLISICINGGQSAECDETMKWLKSTGTLAKDLVFGSQFSLQSN